MDCCVMAASRSTSSHSLFANASDITARLRLLRALLLSPCRPCPCPCPCPCACACASAFPEFPAAVGDAMARPVTSRNNGDCRGFQLAAFLTAALNRMPAAPDMLASSCTSRAASASPAMAGLPILLCRAAPTKAPTRTQSRKTSPPALPARHGEESSAFAAPHPQGPEQDPGSPGARAATGAASANGTKHNKERYRQAATGQYRRGESRKYRRGKSKR